jgi:hypothetical protein
MAKDVDSMEDSNRCANPSVHDVSAPSRRTLLRGAAASAPLGPLAGQGGLAGCATGTPGAGPPLGFKSVPVGCPDGLWVGSCGVMWIETDMSTSAMGKGDLAGLGNNAMLAADPVTGEVRRFLVGPAGCEITGATATPDGRTMFINIQHPGESPGERSDPAEPRRNSNWPDQRPDGRPRSATVVIRRNDGGVNGS